MNCVEFSARWASSPKRMDPHISSRFFCLFSAIFVVVFLSMECPCCHYLRLFVVVSSVEISYIRIMKFNVCTQGNTKVLAAVYGPHESRSGKAKSVHDRAILNCQFSMATFSTGERKKRPHGDRKSLHISMNLKQVQYRFGRICKCYMSLFKVAPPTA